jgi:hypothetical protein
MRRYYGPVSPRLIKRAEFRGDFSLIVGVLLLGLMAYFWLFD